MREKKVAILIPVHNEKLTINKVIQDFYNFLNSKNYNFEIYVYDNNSTDGTIDCVEQLNLPNIICREEKNQGKGNVVRRMFREVDADCYILIDGDDTYPISDVDKLINCILNENIDMAVGDRLNGNYYKENTRQFHSFGNKLVSFLINKLFNSNISDIMSGYRAFSRRYVKLSGLLSQGFEIETEMTIIALDCNFNIKEIPVNYKERIEGSESKLNTYTDGLKVIKTILTLFKDYKPFEFFFSFFILFLIISITLFIPIVIEFFKTGLVLRFPTLFISIFFAILSIFSLCTASILSSLVKLQKRAKEVQILNYKEKIE